MSESLGIDCVDYKKVTDKVIHAEAPAKCELSAEAAARFLEKKPQIEEKMKALKIR